MPIGSVGYENEVNERGERYVWPEPTWSIGSGRSPGEGYSDIFLRLAGSGEPRQGQMSLMRR